MAVGAAGGTVAVGAGGTVGLVATVAPVAVGAGAAGTLVAVAACVTPGVLVTDAARVADATGVALAVVVAIAVRVMLACGVALATTVANDSTTGVIDGAPGTGDASITSAITVGVRGALAPQPANPPMMSITPMNFRIVSPLRTQISRWRRSAPVLLVILPVQVQVRMIQRLRDVARVKSGRR